MFNTWSNKLFRNARREELELKSSAFNNDVNSKKHMQAKEWLKQNEVVEWRTYMGEAFQL